MKYKYLVFVKDRYGNVGRMQIDNEKKIKNITDLDKMDEFIKKEKNIDVQITDYKYLGISWK